MNLYSVSVRRRHSYKSPVEVQPTINQILTTKLPNKTSSKSLFRATKGLKFLANIVILIDNITIFCLFFIFILHNAHIGVELWVGWNADFRAVNEK